MPFLQPFLTIGDIDVEKISGIGEGAENLSSLLGDLGDAVKEKLPTILFAALILFVGIMLSNITLRLMKRGLKKRKLTGADTTVNTFLYSLVKICFYVVIITIVLSVIGVPTTSLIAVIGTAGVAIGLALKDSLSNVAGGFILLFTKPFKIGDYISANGTEGSVKAINILYTELRTFDNKAVYIPNGAVTNAVLINFSKCDTRRLDLTFAVPLTANLKNARDIIVNTAVSSKSVLDSPAPMAGILEQTAVSVNITLRVWVATGDYWNVFFDLNEKVREELLSNGINAPHGIFEILNPK